MKINAIYIAKCIGILLIVAEHTITLRQPDYYSNPFITMVKAFSMPAFMVLSGFVISNKPLDDKWINSKVKTNFLILTTTAILYYAWYKLLPQYSMLQIETPLTLLEYMAYNFFSGFSILVTWYLYVMLICYIILSGLWQMSDRWKWINISSLVVLSIVLINILPLFALGFGLVKWYGTFMLLGYLIGTHRDKLRKYLWLSYVGIPAFFIFGIMTNWMVNWQDLSYGRGGYTNIMQAIINGRGVLLIVMVLAVILGCLALIGIARALEHIKMIQKPILYIGINVLWIYLLHPLFVGVFNNTIISVIFSVLCSITICEFVKLPINLSQVRV